MPQQPIIFSTYDAIGNPYFGGGGAQAIHQVAKRLVTTQPVIIVHGNYPGATNRTIDGVTYKPIGPVIPHPQIGQLLFQLILPIAVVRYRFAVWVESFTPPFSTAFLPFFTRKPVIGLVHLLSGAAMAQKYKFPLFPVLERFGLRTYRSLIALTATSAKTLKQLAPKATITVIPNGVSIPQKAVATIKPSTISYIGRIDVRQKGLDILIAAFDRVAEEIPYDLCIAGGGRPKQIRRLQALIRSCKHAQRIRYIGPVTGKQKQNFFAQSICIVLPSRYETQPLVIFEAFAAQRAVITSTIPELNWLSKQYCQKVPLTVESFGKAMLFLYRHPNKINSLIKKAYVYVQQFSWDNTAQAYQQLLNPERKKYILLTHFFTEHNRGDAGIVSGMLDRLRQQFPKAIFLLNRMEAPHTPSSLSASDVVALSSFFYHAVYTRSSATGKIWNICSMLLITVLWAIYFRFTQKQANWLVTSAYRPLLQAYVAAEKIVAVGGGYLNAKATGHGTVTLVLQLHAIVIALLLNKPVILYSQSVGPFATRLQRWMAGVVLRKVQEIQCREDFSVQTCKSLGIPPSKIRRTPDAAFFFQTNQESRAYMAKELRTLGINHKKLVGISVREWLEPAKQQQLEKSIAQTAEYIRDTHGYTVVLIPQVTAAEHTDDDRVCLRRVFTYLDKQHNIVLLEKTYSHWQIKALYEQLEFCIGTRMHANIFALASGVPVIAIEYTYKTSGIMRDLDLSKWVIAMVAVTFERLRKMVDALCDGYP